MKKRFKLKSLLVAVDTSPKVSHHENLRYGIDRLENILKKLPRSSSNADYLIEKKKAKLENDKDYKLPKRRLCVHNRNWSWHIGWWGWLSFDWNISWIARKFGKTINPDGSQHGAPTYNEYRGILGYHCDL